MLVLLLEPMLVLAAAWLVLLLTAILLQLLMARLPVLTAILMANAGGMI